MVITRLSTDVPDYTLRHAPHYDYVMAEHQKTRDNMFLNQGCQKVLSDSFISDRILETSQLN